MADFEFQLDDFLPYCSSQNLSPKTVAGHAQTWKLSYHESNAT